MSNREPTFDLLEGFLGRQRQLSETLARGRAQRHKVTAGTTSEGHWAAMLDEFLPDRYSIGTACTIVDSHGAQADQIDIVIYDGQYAPRLITHGEGEHIITVESVYAVFEVKPELSKATVVYAGNKAASVRRLRRYPGETSTIDGAKRKLPGDILAGILATDASWNAGVGGECEAVVRSLDDEHLLTFGCTSNAGAYYYEGSEGSFSVAPPETGLIAFASQLFKHLQLLGNATAIDIDRYTDTLWQ